MHLPGKGLQETHKEVESPSVPAAHKTVEAF
ncbi:hypothetical protein POKO110462_18835 [Pontibacter korlensis]